MVPLVPLGYPCVLTHPCLRLDLSAPFRHFSGLPGLTLSLCFLVLFCFRLISVWFYFTLLEVTCIPYLPSSSVPSAPSAIISVVPSSRWCSPSTAMFELSLFFNWLVNPCFSNAGARSPTPPPWTRTLGATLPQPLSGTRMWKRHVGRMCRRLDRHQWGRPSGAAHKVADYPPHQYQDGEVQHLVVADPQVQVSHAHMTGIVTPKILVGDTNVKIGPVAG